MLGLQLRARWAEGAYLEAGNLWLCLSVDADASNGPNTDSTHYAFDVADADFDALVARVRDASIPEWRSDNSEGASLYILDPDLHRLELQVGDLASSLAHYRATRPAAMELFD